MGVLKVMTIKDIYEMWRDRRDNDFDNIVLVDGGTGQGKSTFVNKTLMRFGDQFKPWRDQIYSRDDALKQIATRQKALIWSDEMINIAHNRNFMTPDQILLVKRLNMYRDHNNTFVGCVPAFQELDTQLLRLAHMRITLLRRGVALVQMPKRSLYSKDPWDIKNNAKIEAEWNSKGTKNPRYGRLSTAKGMLFFNDMTEGQRVLYKEIKRIKRAKIYGKLEEEEEARDPEKQWYNNVITMMQEGKVDRHQFMLLCTSVNRKYRTAQIRINEILRDRGANERFRDLLFSNNTKGKKDLLGFNLEANDG